MQGLKSKGVIEIISHDDTSALHIRVVDYESWVSVPKADPDSVKRQKKEAKEKFLLFWNEYHNVTQLPKENIAKAQREWKKLSDKERELAVGHIEEYYFHQTNANFLLHASSYLANKAFLNEY